MTQALNTIALLYVPCPTQQIAQGIGHQLVEEKLAGCINILGNITSIYKWEGKVEQNQECLMVVKTSKTQTEACAARIKILHPYEVPCILDVQATSLNDAYSAWLSQNLVRF
jgi:periplasmic divalent cation tolerance protein